jgi:hypothetical protein
LELLGPDLRLASRARIFFSISTSDFAVVAPVFVLTGLAFAGTAEAAGAAGRGDVAGVPKALTAARMAGIAAISSRLRILS